MGITEILPFHQSSSSQNGLSISPSLISRRSFRPRERYLILLMCVAFVMVCFGTVFFLPDLRANLAAPAVEKVYLVYQQVQNVGPELILPGPPLAKEDELKFNAGMGGGQHHGQIDKPDSHLLQDQARLMAKIEYEEQLEMQRQSQKVLPKPDIFRKQETSSSSSPKAIVLPAQVEAHEDVQEPYQVKKVPKFDGEMPLIQGGEDPDADIRSKRDVVRNMMKHAWHGYAKYAWGSNELKPISKRGHSSSIFGNANLGASIVDGLDTLFIMGLMDEYQQGKEWVASNLNMTYVSTDLSVFETIIRFVGGLLSLYALTGDTMYLEKADLIAEKLLPAFNTPTGIPKALVNPQTGFSKNFAWASGGSSILSEFGTIQLELGYLSDAVSKPVYREKLDRIKDVLRQLEKPNGLYPNYLNPITGKWGQQHVSMGGLGDSFYEYLLKVWLQSGKQDEESKLWYIEAMDAVLNQLLVTSKSGLLYFADMKSGRLEHSMGHLACFSGGMLALGAQTLQHETADRHMQVAAGITNTCHESYDRTATKLGPEAFRFTDAFEAKALKANEKYYILRPEVIESYFYMWRFTKDPKYRQWGWDAVEALEKHCRVEGGYSGLKNVYSEDSVKDDVQQSFFLAETLKYLYLLFSNDDLISLDEWVFNSEAHPLPVRGKNPFYRIA